MMKIDPLRLLVGIVLSLVGICCALFIWFCWRMLMWEQAVKQRNSSATEGAPFARLVLDLPCAQGEPGERFRFTV